MSEKKIFLICLLIGSFFPSQSFGICSASFRLSIPSNKKVVKRNEILAPYKTAKAEVRRQGFKNKAAFKKWEDRPIYIPKSPEHVYDEEFEGWPEFLGTKREWMSVEEAQVVARNVNVTNTREMLAWLKSDRRPFNFPASPGKVYKGEWRGIKEFTGKDPYNKKKIKLHEEINSSVNPETAYGEQNGVTEFNGEVKDEKEIKPQTQINFPGIPRAVHTESHGSKRESMSVKEARVVARNANVINGRGMEKWLKSDRRPFNFPSNPEIVYEGEWRGLIEFLGIDPLNKTEVEPKGITASRNSRVPWMSVEEARVVARNANVTNWQEVIEWLKSDRRPFNFPSNPEIVYEGEWRGFSEFLRTDDQVSSISHSENVEDLVSSLFQLEDKEDDRFFFSSHREGSTIDTKSTALSRQNDPLTETSASKEHRDFPETEDIMTFEEAQDYIIDIGIETEEELFKWLLSSDRPKDFPLNPSRAYKEQWRGVRYFLNGE